MLAYVPDYAEAKPAQAAQVMPLRAFDTQAGLGYAVHLGRVSLDGATIEGAADNVLQFKGQFRAGNWLLAGSAWRLKAPVTATVLATTANPALTPEISELRARAGYVLGLPLGLEAAPSVALVSQELAPGGSGVPVTGTPLDFAQTRRGLGLDAPVVLPLGDRVEVALRGAVFPWAASRLIKAPYAFDQEWLHLFEGQAGLKVALVGGLDAELAVGISSWQGDVKVDGRLREFRDLASTVTLGLVYRPERVGR
jgi:hypothetical protein